ncbi:MULTISPECIES: pilus assembly protein PilM [unclassified Arsukibacterium]|uniref:pilus assembly protein PilM n=1 Tax=unclassified Arsukibacterium TaxID=2635278 RepID=UPI000C4C278D|nr:MULTISPECIES: pilus assembly protein PilM [unclassified Arsukibacterium]MAA95999.1 pilus assembly protein PilM [Rheinheimera sp.]MBM34294.1 pilus assembly protein PilM [Rheinheimera sp.]HAW92318.1 pilus assembly protein PilM [Candidatus Azambacteria bacterium]|tara:strand:+ start:8988 stop:10067 length:1080 start_codon:yes stop_codon:yes gene_type:complete
MIKSLFSKQTPMMVGIDIGAHSVKAVLLSQHGNQYKVEAFAVEPMIKGAMSDREIQDIEAVGNVIGKIRKKIPRSLKFAAAAVSGSTVISKVIFMDVSLTDAELESQIEVEADTLIPYPLNEVSLDFEKLDVNESDPSKVNVLLSAARTESVEARVAALDNGGFSAKLVDVESYALSRAAELCLKQLPDDAAGKVVALVDIGATMTLLSIVEKGKTLYTRDQAFGGEQYTRSILSYYNKSYDEAELAKVSGDLPPNYTFEVLAPFQTMLLQQIRRGIQMYLTSSGRDAVDYLIVSGGTALIEGIDRLLIDELGIHTVVANPFKTIDVATSVDREQLNKSAPQLMVASGLALRSFSSWHI